MLEIALIFLPLNFKKVYILCSILSVYTKVFLLSLQLSISFSLLRFQIKPISKPYH